METITITVGLAKERLNTLKHIKIDLKTARERPFKSQSIHQLSEAQFHLFTKNFKTEVNNFSHGAAKLGKYKNNFP